MLARTFETFDELVRRLEPSLADWVSGSMDGSRQPRILAPMEILRTDSGIVVRVDLPGVDPDSIDVTVLDGTTLRVRAERRAPTAGQGEYLRRGFAYGTFEGTVRLPAGIDAGALSARYDAGVLEIRVPHAAVQAVKVPVEAGSVRRRRSRRPADSPLATPPEGRAHMGPALQGAWAVNPGL